MLGMVDLPHAAGADRGGKLPRAKLTPNHLFVVAHMLLPRKNANASKTANAVTIAAYTLDDEERATRAAESADGGAGLT